MHTHTHDQEPAFVVNSIFLYRFLFSKFVISELCHIGQFTKLTKIPFGLLTHLLWQHTLAAEG